MSKILKSLLCTILTVTIAFTAIIPAGASGRVVNYLSELQLAEGKDAAAAKALLEAENFKIIDKNLNPGGDKAVYLGYKTSTNVEDAITDISVMNMNGGFNLSDYETIMEDALNEYKDTVDNIRIAANEFAENYKAGKKEALLAYRQMNYYYDEQPVLDENGDPVLDENGVATTVQTKMGDYMLNFPENNEDFANILLKGNTQVLDNLKTLLAMGVGDSGALIDRISAAAQDEAVYEKLEYYDYAKEFAKKIDQLKVMLATVQAEIDEVMADTEMTDEEKDDALIFARYNCTILLGFDELLKTIPVGDTNYSDYFNTAEEIDYSMLYPIVHAMTPGQRAMAFSGQLQSVFVYSAVETSDEELETKLAEVEEVYDSISVYFGTDMELLEGAVGVTSDAIAEENSTGNKWFACFTGNEGLDITISTLFGVGGVTLVGFASHFLKQQYNISQATLGNLDKHTLWFDKNEIAILGHNLKDGKISAAYYAEKVKPWQQEIDAINAKVTVSTTTVVLSSIGLAVGIAMIAFSAYSIYRIVDSYNVEYTKIPSNMVNTVETDNGNRFINYKVVNALYEKDGKVKERPGDTNGYDGNQWNAIYYTKNYEAGKCMTGVPDLPTTETDFGKYSPVHKFGTGVCYDLNLYNGKDNTEKVFLAFGNSNNKKAAATNVPTVVGSAFTYGIAGITGVAGIGLGMGIMAVIKRKKKEA